MTPKCNQIVETLYRYMIIFPFFQLNLYVTPIIIFLGVTGNLMSFLVFACTHLQRQSSSVYLATLAVVDTVFLLSMFIVWLNLVGIQLFRQTGWCQLVVYLTHLCRCMSVWIVVGFTTDRYIIVYHPLRKDRLCTTKVAKIVVFTISSVSLLAYSYSTWTSGIVIIFGIRNCMPFAKYYDLLTVLSSVDIIIALLVPSVIILVLNIRIVQKIHEFQRTLPSASKGTSMSIVMPTGSKTHRVSIHASISHRGSMLYQFGRPLDFYSNVQSVVHEPVSCNGAIPVKPTKSTIRGHSQFRLARMLLIVSTIFLLLNIPSHYFVIRNFIREWFCSKVCKVSRNIVTWQELFQLVYYLNCAINFFLYSLCGRPFRNELKRLCSKLSYNAHRYQMNVRKKPQATATDTPGKQVADTNNCLTVVKSLK